MENKRIIYYLVVISIVMIAISLPADTYMFHQDEVIMEKHIEHNIFTTSHIFVFEHYGINYVSANEYYKYNVGDTYRIYVP